MPPVFMGRASPWSVGKRAAWRALHAGKCRRHGRGRFRETRVILLKQAGRDLESIPGKRG